ncbi:YicC/YloC family endoribonuclease [Fusibacter tunisiensis]|uniref:Uncharacterized protein (TIGR00255 family) n=1 Tax=Fusibacter tunisiensis TaxID=1008308 RepID=A0ABS2MMA0_9FIRM|nr:YicC/YloC family endoribonuclease [Fusibacter tunisiensis]MBM7560530.1 uncharacterized protein (TIGR00255 family) [Fusibacter tunisiensis]
MIYSMTGFGRGEFSSGVFDVTVEMRAVNNRYCDIVVKMPKKLTVFEERIKSKVKSELSRGRVDVYINLEETSHDNYAVKANYEILDRFVEVYRSISERYDLKDDVSLALLSRVQDGIEVSYEDRDEAEFWNAIEPALTDALKHLMEMRSIEGQQLKIDVLQKIANIKENLEKLSEYAPLIVSTYRKKITDRIEELLSDMNAEIDASRIANEIAIFSDKTNINEEIVRIHSHLEQIERILETDVPVGRKLDFLIQELNREVNTIGSKSPDSEISTLVIELKSDLEQIREQIQNIE